tara:strand:- start:5 stop:832 length:828 start_codon:yes stop_codon:yes gene_type:complete
MAQPFALENLASKVGLAQKRAQQDYFDARATEATNLLAKQLDKMQKEASKRTGFFDKTFGDFGGLVKTGIGMINPVAGLIAGGLDTATSQKDLKRMIKKAGKDINIPARFKGTFLEDYLTGGMMQGQAGLKQNLQGRKQADLITNLVSMIPTAVSAAKTLPLTKTTSEMVNLGAGETIMDQGGLASIEGQAMKNITSPTKLGNIVSKINQTAVPFTSGLLNVGNLTTPLVKGGKMATALSTPGMYAPILQNLLQDYLLGSPEEPVMTRAQAPKVY